MKQEFIPYEQALELKELGFNEPCVAYYTADAKQLSLVQGYDSLMFADYIHLANTVKSIPCPLYQQAFRWFREKHKIISVIDFHCYGDDWEDVVHEVRISEFEHFKTHDSFIESEYKTYEEAELACLKQLIEILKNK